jgi:hypothetical protein
MYGAISQRSFRRMGKIGNGKEIKESKFFRQKIFRCGNAREFLGDSCEFLGDSCEELINSCEFLGDSCE